MTCALIITTYNWKEALELVLESALNQSVAPDEIIIADDGSREDTKELIETYIEKFTLNIIHSWQEDKGFRLAHSRNRAIACSKSEYIIVVDGDMVLDVNFVKDHKKWAKKNTYLQGSRVLLLDALSKDVLKNKKIPKISLFSDNVKNNLNLIYSPFLTSLFTLNRNQDLNRIRGCNFSLYKEDILKVNGFNEAFTTWGKEDSEFVQRLYHIGIERINIKFSAKQYHLYHPEGNANNNNIELLNNTIQTKLEYCENGITKYL